MYKKIIIKQLSWLKSITEEKGYNLTWKEAVIEHLLTKWQPNLGVRYLSLILRNRVNEQLSLADAQGELNGITQIVLVPMEISGKEDSDEISCSAKRIRKNDTLLIELL